MSLRIKTIDQFKSSTYEITSNKSKVYNILRILLYTLAFKKSKTDYIIKIVEKYPDTNYVIYVIGSILEKNYDAISNNHTDDTDDTDNINKEINKHLSIIEAKVFNKYIEDDEIQLLLDELWFYYSKLKYCNGHFKHTSPMLRSCSACSQFFSVFSLLSSYKSNHICDNIE